MMSIYEEIKNAILTIFDIVDSIKPSILIIFDIDGLILKEVIYES